MSTLPSLNQSVELAAAVQDIAHALQPGSSKLDLEALTRKIRSDT